MAILNRATILAAPDLKPELVKDVIGLGGDVYVRGLTAAEYDSYQGSLMSYKTVKDEKGEDKIEVERHNDNLRARLVVLGCVDENGNNLFVPEDAEALGRKNALGISQLYDRISELSGMNVRTKDIEKNSGSGRSGDSN